MSSVAKRQILMRRTRQQTREAAVALDDSMKVPGLLSVALNAGATAVPIVSWPSVSIKTLPFDLTPASTGLDVSSLNVLHDKQQRLQQTKVTASFGRSKLARAADATLVFAQDEAGTGVCISSYGVILTCSHCVAESTEELRHTNVKWLLFASGQIVQAECVAWDSRRDLALLQIVAAQPQEGVTQRTISLPAIVGTTSSFPFVSIAEASPSLRAPLVCIGHPGSEDLEASRPGVKTEYDVLHVSAGLYRGVAPDQDLQDNSEIGSLRHDCWTYWGHSGAPLIHRSSGHLIGLHSSWDPETTMRCGVPLEAIQQFLQQHTSLLASK